MSSSSSSHRVFGQAMKKKKGGGGSKYQRQFGGGGGGNKNNISSSSTTDSESIAAKTATRRRLRQEQGEKIDTNFGYHRLEDQLLVENGGSSNNGDDIIERRGWLFHMLPTTIIDKGDGIERAGLDLYFIGTNHIDRFKTTILYRPYFYLVTKTSSSSGGLNNTTNNNYNDEAEELSLGDLLLKTFDGSLANVEYISKIDLDQPNHLSPNASTRKVWKLSFDTVTQLVDVRNQLFQIIKKKQGTTTTSTYGNNTENDSNLLFLDTTNHYNNNHTSSTTTKTIDPWSRVIELREYDVPYVVRVCMDLNIRAGSWFTVSIDSNDSTSSSSSGGNTGGGITTQPQPKLINPDIETKADPTVLAFDIECTKAPLKFPSADVDEIYMISYMVGGGNRDIPQGYLICSRTVVSQDIHDFEYTPKPKYPGPFKIFNEVNEITLIKRFIKEFQQLCPQIVVTYNGDSFDWPFLQARAEHHGINLWLELGITSPSSLSKNKDDSGGGLMSSSEVLGRCCIHLDAFSWVQRDSYLPQGAQGLKAVTKYKLGYDPVEVDPEDMTPMAQERPIHMATYSVSDAVATYYLYDKYVHLFIFSLCTLIPMGPEDVLRKGSGTLCEALLMVQACSLDIICPNKQVDPLAKFYKGHLLESETYIGGKVECLETGVYRSDVEYDFDLKPKAFQGLIDNIDRDLTFAIEVEGGLDKHDIINYEDVRTEIIEQLELLRDRPKRCEKPYIYHLDVGAMYPNIILTNRLQPSAIVTDSICAACDYNQEKNQCKRRMDWVWRGDYSPADKLEYNRTKDQLSREIVDTTENGDNNNQRKYFKDLSDKEQAKMVSNRLKAYTKNAYKKTKITEEVTRNDIVCMRENDFYVETVRRFRDRRYDYKKMTKSWKKKIGTATNPSSKKEAEDKALVYDSLQVAHKCILNSFYGYVMRKGARWRSMEMAGIVTKTGADLIVQARLLVEQIGRPLELDTDGIWCILPKSFPDVYTFKTKDGSKIKLEYPCVMLNADVHDKFTNHQYQTLTDPKRGIYETRSDNSIFFEVDGPYRCMVLPASTEEGKLLKKRYAVFNFDGSLAELKGFELKRRGELELIKTFQSQVFERFLDGSSLIECYDSVADVANHWIDVIDTRGESLDDDELVDLISENRNMSRQLDDYGDQKGTSQTTARRLGEFLGAEIIKDKGLNCKFIIAEQPYGAPVTERAVPTAIWKAEPSIKKHFLRKWLKSPGLDGDGFDIRNILDWDYYLDRLGKTIQKIITIPAALQKVPNPVPRVPHPNWLHSKVQQLNEKFQQQSIRDLFGIKKQQQQQQRHTKMITNTTTTTTATDNDQPVVMDIEDIGGTNSSTLSKRPIVHTIKRRRNLQFRNKESKEQEENEEHQKQQERIQLNKDKEQFDDWLKQKKSLWRKVRRDRKRMNTDGSRNSSNTSGSSTTTSILGEKRPRRTGASSMEGFVREAALNLTQREWQVIEVREMTSLDNNGQITTSTGAFTVWVMVGTNSLQKIQITIPRTVFVSTRKEIEYDLLSSSSSDILEFKKVEKHLPHARTAEFLYEISMYEYVYKKKNWLANFKPMKRHGEDKNTTTTIESVLDQIYETGTPLMLRALMELGCVSRLNPSSSSSSKSAGRGLGQKAYLLSDLKRIDRPNEGLYLNSNISYKRCFLYVRLNPRTKTGIVALFTMSGGSGTLRNNNTNNNNNNDNKNNDSSTGSDLTAPTQSKPGSFDVSASCQIWIVKPGSRRGQKNVTLKQCEGLFSQLLNTIQETADLESEYACVSPQSSCTVSNLTFVDREQEAYTAANDAVSSHSKSSNGPMFLLLNCGRPAARLRRHMTALNSCPVIPMPFPPGPDHNPSMSTLPALNWEQPAVQLCLEAYLYMGIVSFPKRVAYARYGNLPVGNLGIDENFTLFDISLVRMLQKNRALSWANPIPGKPDLGAAFIPSTNGRTMSSLDLMGGAGIASQDDIWGDEKDLISPVIRRPGCYRSLCIDIDVQDLAIAALTDASTLPSSNLVGGVQGLDSSNNNQGSPTSVALFDGRNNGGQTSMMKFSEPLGDEMSTLTALPIMRALVGAWLRDAFSLNSQVADTMLHHLYRLISNPETMMHDPALHRVVHALMKTTFLRLLNELQRLGCSVVYATFHRITVATNKTNLADAEEYINFVISTVRSSSRDNGVETSALTRVALSPRQFHTHFLFLDEYNFGTMRLERNDDNTDEDIENDFIVEKDEASNTIVNASVVTAWSIMNYLGSETAQGYFRIIIARFSKEVLRKQLELQQLDQDKNLPSIFFKEFNDKLLDYKKKMVSKHFAAFLTRAVGEILKDGSQDQILPPFMSNNNRRRRPTSPVLEFIKAVMVVLQLDSEIETELHILKRSLLSQVGVAEYSSLAKWENPCPTFILPDVFCTECHESRDINLCYIPPPDDEDNGKQIHWFCEDCGNEYDVDGIERRLIDYVHSKMMRYQLQDSRCSKTNRVSTQALAKVSTCSAEWKLDTSQDEAQLELETLQNLAVHHELDELNAITDGMLRGFR